MPQYVDCYWLIESRDNVFGEKFLDEVIPKREKSAVDYPVPIYSNTPPIIVFSKVGELMEYLKMNVNEEYSIYWRNLDNNNIFKHGMIFYTDDGKMIFGVSIEGNEPDDETIKVVFLKLLHWLNSKVGCITVEEVAPSNSLEFLEFCKDRYVPE